MAAKSAAIAGTASRQTGVYTRLSCLALARDFVNWLPEPVSKFLANRISHFVSCIHPARALCDRAEFCDRFL
jgi:hypothetical protein